MNKNRLLFIWTNYYILEEMLDINITLRSRAKKLA